MVCLTTTNLRHVCPISLGQVLSLGSDQPTISIVVAVAADIGLVVVGPKNVSHFMTKCVESSCTLVIADPIWEEIFVLVRSPTHTNVVPHQHEPHISCVEEIVHRI